MTNTNPEYAFRIKRFLWNISPNEVDLFSIDGKGDTRIGYNGVSTGEKLLIGKKMGIFHNATNKINLTYSGTQPEISWQTSSNKNLRFINTNNNKTPLSLSTTGKVGINTEDFFGDHDLYVNGSVYLKGDSPETHSLYIEGSTIAEEFTLSSKNEWSNSSVGNLISFRFEDVNNNLKPEILWNSSNNSNFSFRNSTTSNIPLILSANGKVGINTDDFFDNHNLYINGSVYIKDDGEEAHSLYIEGSSIAEEMFVKLKSAWPDYVFHEDYILMPLVELQNFIDENGHLPEIPIAEEVAENGIAAGETIRLLTKKVEELTLYILQQQKEIDSLKENTER